MKRTTRAPKISTVTFTFGGVTYQATATDRLEALAAIARFADAERAQESK